MANPFLTDVTVNGTKQSVGVPGRILLPDTKGAPAVVEAEVTAPGRPEDEAARRLVGRLRGAARRQADRRRRRGPASSCGPTSDAFDVTLPAGKHTLAVVVKGGGGRRSTPASSTPTASCAIPMRTRESDSPGLARSS